MRINIRRTSNSKKVILTPPKGYREIPTETHGRGTKGQQRKVKFRTHRN